MIKNCKTCAHCIPNKSMYYSYCVRAMKFCEYEVCNGVICGPELKQWTPKQSFIRSILNKFTKGTNAQK